MSESYWGNLFHKEVKSWDSTTWFRIWQFLTTVWKWYLQMHRLAERFFVFFFFEDDDQGLEWSIWHQCRLLTLQRFFCLCIYSLWSTVSHCWTHTYEILSEIRTAPIPQVQHNLHRTSKQREGVINHASKILCSQALHPWIRCAKKKKKERKKNEKEHMPQMISSRQNSPAEGRAALVPLLQFTIPR